MNTSAGTAAPRLHLRTVPAETPSPRQYFLTRTNGDSTPVCVGPFASRDEVNAEAKKVKAEFASSRILITVAIAEVQPVKEPMEIVDLGETS